ncbi:MAG: hypothetical protein ACI9XK_004647, partial [Granulosicoccus sp.]
AECNGACGIGGIVFTPERIMHRDISTWSFCLN